MSNLDLAVIGNCGYGALIDGRGRVVWVSLVRFDRDTAVPGVFTRKLYSSPFKG